MNPETILQNQIRAALSEAVLFRANVGRFYTEDGRPIKIGEPGFPDLHGHRRSDGKAVYIEVKLPGQYPTKKQREMLTALVRSGALVGVARNIEDARGIVKGELRWE